MSEIAPFGFTAVGTPVPQGSKTRTRWSIRDDNADRLKPWRETVTGAALDVVTARGGGPVFPRGVPVVVSFRFFFPPTVAAEKARKKGIRTVPAARPDWDKIARSVGDSMTDAQVWADDGQVAAGFVSKAWAFGRPPGVDVTVTCWTADAPWLAAPALEVAG